MRFAFAFVFGLAFSFQVCAATIHVPADQPTIQAGINAAANGDTILVASGTYVENIDFSGKAVVLRSEAGRDFTFIEPANPNAVIVRFDSGEDTTSVINGFTVRNTSYAYGILCLNSGPIIENCDVSFCTGPGDGGGIRCIYSGAKIRDNRVHHNTGEVTGGGISVTQQTSEVLEITGNEVYQNVAPHGPGIGAPSIGNTIISRNVIWGNVGYAEYGGGIYIDAIFPFIRVFNNTVVGNSKGIVVLGSADVVFKNNIVAFNEEAGLAPNGAVSSYNCVWDNGSANTPGTDGIVADPLFRGALAKDFHLESTSPCINAGDPAAIFNDPDGSRNDMGALPYTAGPEPSSIIIRVPADQPTIQAGIDAAANGDTVLVASGTYVENIDFSGKALVLISEAGREFTFVEQAASGVPIVLFDKGEDTASVISGFTVRNTIGAYGILCVNSSPIIENCDVSYCNRSGDGAGIRCLWSGAKIRGNRVHNNTCTTTGAGISVTQHTTALLEITDNQVYNNTSPHGPGIGCPSIGNVLISRNIIWNNVGSAEWGGGIYVDTEYPFARIYNNTVVGNSKGIVVLRGLDVEILNNIVAFNGGKGMVPGPSVSAYNCVWNNGSNNLPGYNGLVADPKFQDIASDNYRLLPSSPCIDAGDPALAFNDPDGSRNDIGAIPFSPDQNPPNRLIVGPVEYIDCANFQFPIEFVNDSDIVAAVSVPLEWSSSEIVYDSISWQSSRVIDWEIKQSQADNDNQTVLIVATRIIADPVNPGSGLLCNLFFHSQNLQDGSNVCFDTTYIPPGGEFVFADVEANSLYPSFESDCFAFTPPCARLIVPNGGEVFVGHHSENIIWQLASADVDSSVIWLSVDGGATFNSLVGSVIGPDTTFMWAVPVIWEDDCRMMVAHYLSGEIIKQDQSDGLFSLHSIGDVNCSNQLEVSDVVCLINYIFTLGTEPCACMDRAKDVNCDGRYNISDVVYLINFIFNGGPAPCPNNSQTGKVVVPNPTLKLRLSDAGDGIVVSTSSDFELAAVELEISIPARSVADVQLTGAHAGLNLYWRPVNNDRIRVGVVDPSGQSAISAGTTELFSVDFSDDSPVESYDIGGIAVDRKAVEYNLSSLTAPNALPLYYRLDQNRPNPFNPTTSIQYSLPVSGQVELTVYNILGNPVRILVDGVQPAGTYSANWDGRSKSNEVMPSGVYFYRLKIGSFEETKKMLLLK